MSLFHRYSTVSSSSSRSGGEHLHRSRSRRSSGSHSSHSSMSTRSSSSVGHSGHRTVVHRRVEDPSITAAREQVIRAEAAEREADKALMASRSAVKQAWDHVKHLEREAAEEARLAKIKQDQASTISKRARPLGRKCFLEL
ncbi:hypothetical protein N7495_001414 [Penicillium taxi]|uniref:uncharacterized protein n=1 Tax=Penicillium taxi TaxID=168475 RepID=UPI00254503D3|nr:uncharacterized protein N7495_001414 [Penicillium taxi]KAJ5908732.1 hypothetical protein N7495_001414 [Penicillium taxi]